MSNITASFLLSSILVTASGCGSDGIADAGECLFAGVFTTTEAGVNDVAGLRASCLFSGECPSSRPWATGSAAQVTVTIPSDLEGAVELESTNPSIVSIGAFDEIEEEQPCSLRGGFVDVRAEAVGDADVIVRVDGNEVDRFAWGVRDVAGVDLVVSGDHGVASADRAQVCADAGEPLLIEARLTDGDGETVGFTDQPYVWNLGGDAGTELSSGDIGETGAPTRARVLLQSSSEGTAQLGVDVLGVTSSVDISWGPAGQTGGAGFVCGG